MSAVLCAQFIDNQKQVPPVLFDSLVKLYIPIGKVRALNQLLEYKSLGGGKDNLVIPSGIWNFAIDTFERLQAIDFDRFRHSDPKHYDNLMRKAVSNLF